MTNVSASETIRPALFLRPSIRKAANLLIAVDKEAKKGGRQGPKNDGRE